MGSIDDSCTIDGCESGETELTLSKVDDSEREMDDGVLSTTDWADGAGAVGVVVSVAGVVVVR